MTELWESFNFGEKSLYFWLKFTHIKLNMYKKVY